MIAFDADVLTEILAGHTGYVQRAAPIPVSEQAVPVVVIEEILRGRLNSIRQAEAAKSKLRIERAYELFEKTLDAFRHVIVLPYATDAEALFQQWRGQRIRIGTHDLRIAAICVVNSATLVTRNLRDFEHVPGLSLEVWQTMLDNSLAAKLHRLDELERDFAGAVERAKLAALKELAYGASHEINNPLANISTRAQSLLADEKHPERRKKLATIVAQAFRAHEMISDLMLFANPPPLALSTVRVHELLATVVAECKNDAAEQQTELAIGDCPPDLVIEADATHLAVAIKALIRNALEALGQAGRIEITAANRDDQVTITVADNGPGISSRVREHLFDPFYSGREAGRGLGFGLSKCWRIAELHGGSVGVESEPGQGATFRILLPAQPASSS